MDQKRAQAVRLRLAELYARSLEQPARAIAVYRSALEQRAARTSRPAPRWRSCTCATRSATAMAIEEHRQLLKLEPTRVESLHALFKLWEGHEAERQGLLRGGGAEFLRSANEVEVVFYNEAKARLPQEGAETLALADLDSVLLHPFARGPLLEVLRAMGDQLSKLYPPQFEMLGVDKKADKLKPDSAVFKAIRTVAQRVRRGGVRGLPWPAAG